MHFDRAYKVIANFLLLQVYVVIFGLIMKTELLYKYFLSELTFEYRITLQLKLYLSNYSIFLTKELYFTMSSIKKHLSKRFYKTFIKCVASYD